MASHFGCRPISMFDTRIRSQSRYSACRSASGLVASRFLNREGVEVKDYNVKDGQDDEDVVILHMTPNGHLDTDDPVDYDANDSNSDTDDEMKGNSDLRCPIDFFIAPKPHPKSAQHPFRGRDLCSYKWRKLSRS